MSNNHPSSAYSDGYNAIREKMYRCGILRKDPRSGFSDVTDKQAYTDFLEGVKASLEVLLKAEETETMKPLTTAGRRVLAEQTGET